MKNYLLLLVLMLLFATGCKSPVNTANQSVENIDAANIPKERLEKHKRQFEEAANDIDKLKVLMDAAIEAEDVPEEKEAIRQQLIDFTEKVPDCEVKVAAYCTLITLYEETDAAQSFTYFEKAMNLIPKLPEYSDVMKAEAYITITQTCALYNDYEYLQPYLFEAIPILEAIPEEDYPKIKDKTHVSIYDALTGAYLAVVVLYQFYEQTEKIDEYLNTLLVLAEKNDNLFNKAMGYFGYAYNIVADEPEKALAYIEKGYKIGIANQYLAVINTAYEFFSYYEREKGNIASAIAWKEKDLEYLKGKQKPYLEMTDYYVMARLYGLLPNGEEKQLELCLKGLPLADSLKAKRYAEGFHNMLAVQYAKHENYKEAYNHQTKRIEIMADVKSEESMRQINFLTARYDVERREIKIREMEEREKTHKILLFIGFSVCVLVIALLLVILHFRKRHNRILAEMNATKDKFFSIISHDLKNPAIAQRDAIQQLINNADRWNSNDLTQYYSDLLKSANEEVELLYSLLSWAQIQTGRMSYTPVTFDLSTHLRTDIALIRKMVEYKKITFTDHIPPNVPITGDINMIVTVVRNLLTNAVKFTPAGGEILLTVEPAPNDKYIVTVSDTGTGMTPEQIHNLFCIDNRHSRQGTIGEQGSGLGLIVCKDMLERHKSVLHIESEEGKGSRFWFEI